MESRGERSGKQRTLRAPSGTTIDLVAAALAYCSVDPDRPPLLLCRMVCDRDSDASTRVSCSRCAGPTSTSSRAPSRWRATRRFCQRVACSSGRRRRGTPAARSRPLTPRLRYSARRAATWASPPPGTRVCADWRPRVPVRDWDAVVPLEASIGATSDSSNGRAAARPEEVVWRTLRHPVATHSIKAGVDIHIREPAAWPRLRRIHDGHVWPPC